MVSSGVTFKKSCIHSNALPLLFPSPDKSIPVKKVRKKDGIYVNMDGIDTSYLEDLECPLWEWKEAREHMKVENLEYVVENIRIHR